MMSDGIYNQTDGVSTEIRGVREKEGYSHIEEASERNKQYISRINQPLAIHIIQ